MTTSEPPIFVAIFFFKKRGGVGGVSFLIYWMLLVRWDMAIMAVGLGPLATERASEQVETSERVLRFWSWCFFEI